MFQMLVAVAAATGCRGEPTASAPRDGGVAPVRGSAGTPAHAAGVGGSNVGADRFAVAGVAGVSTAGTGPRIATDDGTIAAVNGDEITRLGDAAGYVVRRKELDLEEAGSCCCYGKRKVFLSATKQKARVTISDARTGEVLVERVFDPPKTCPKLQGLEGIEPSFTLSVPASVIEAWARKRVRELERRKQRPALVPKN